MAIQSTDNLFGVAKIIVDPVLGRGTHTTIATALTSASSGDTIFIRPGTYTEDLTLKAGVNLVAFQGSGDTPNVIISGNNTATFVGSTTISGIRLQTNSAPFITVSGSSATIVNIENCYLNCLNNTGITYSSSSANSRISIRSCSGNIATTGIGLFTQTSAGILVFYDSEITNTGASTTASTASAGALSIANTYNYFVISTSGTNTFISLFSLYFTSPLSVTAMTIGGSGSNFSHHDIFQTGTGAAISISSNLTIIGSEVISSNANVITGAGTLLYTTICYGSSTTINPTTITRLVVDGGEYKGRTINTAPSAGMIGEQIRATVALGSAVALSNATGANVTSISLTAGIWDISCVCIFRGTLTGTAYFAAISTTSATVSTLGDNTTTTPTSPTASSDNTLTIPSFRASISATTTYFLVAQANFTVGTATAYGRISATRVA